MKNYFIFLLTLAFRFAIISERRCAGIAQLVEQLICNQQVGGSSPSTSSMSDEARFSPLPAESRKLRIRSLRLPFQMKTLRFPFEDEGLEN